MSDDILEQIRRERELKEQRKEEEKEEQEEARRKVRPVIRRFTAISIVLDLIAAVISLLSYIGYTACCGRPVFSPYYEEDSEFSNWAQWIIYGNLVLVILGAIPAMFLEWYVNVLNPLVGLAAAFLVFLEDSMPVAIATWTIEAVSVACGIASKERMKKAKIKNESFGCGVTISTLGSAATLILMVAISQKGGLCYTGTNRNMFQNLQPQEQCGPCSNETGPCEVCGANETMTCFLPFSWDRE